MNALDALRRPPPPRMGHATRSRTLMCPDLLMSWLPLTGPLLPFQRTFGPAGLKVCKGSGVRFRLVRADAPLPCFGPRRRRGRYSAGRCQWWKCGEHRRTRCAPRTTDQSSSPSRFRPGSPASAPKQPTSLPARPDDPRHEGAAGPVRGREISGRRLDADAQAVSRGGYHCLGNIASNIKDLAASGRLFLWVKLAPDRVQ